MNMNFNNKRFLIVSASIFGLLIAILAFSSSCNKKAASYNPDFIGEWRTEAIEDTVLNETVRSEIVIEKKDGLYNGTCRDECSEHLCDCLVQHSGRAVISTDKTQIKFGSSGSFPLSIDKEPYEDASGQWIMIIGGETYYREP
jgi:hypothetical protein